MTSRSVDASETIAWGYNKSEYKEKLKVHAINLKLNRSGLDLSTEIYLCDCSIISEVISEGK